MDSRITAKLFHTVVVVGMGLAQAGCGGDDTPSNTGSSGTTTTTTTTTAQNDAGGADAAKADTMPSWSCCA